MKTKRNSKTNKAIIDVYKTIYDLDIVVANKYATVEQLNKVYCDAQHEDLYEANAVAYTEVGYNRKTDKTVIIVKYVRDSKHAEDKKADLINTAAHEALHACMAIYTKIGEKVFE